MPDAGDAGGEPEDPLWVAMPGLPEGCTIWRAANPAAALNLRWVPCEEDVEGCETIEPPVDGFEHSFEGATEVPETGRTILAMAQREGTWGARVTVLASTAANEENLEVYAAWREPALDSASICAVAPFAVGPADDAFGIFSFRKGHPSEQHLYWAPRSSISETVDPVSILRDERGVGRNVHSLAASADTVAALMLGDFVALVDSEPTHVFSAGADDIRGSPQYPLSVVGSEVFWHSSSQAIRVAHASRDRDTELFLEVEGGDVRYFTGNDQQMAWYEAYGRIGGSTARYERVELWTAPYTADPTSLRRRLVTTIDPAQWTLPAVMGGGHWHYVLPVDDEHFHFELWVIALEEGTKRHLVFPEGYRLEPLMVGEESLLVEAETPQKRGLTRRLFRIRLDAMPIVP